MDKFDIEDMAELMSGADEDQGYKITERVPYADEPETREHKATNRVEAWEIFSTIERDDVASSVVDVDFMD